MKRKLKSNWKIVENSLRIKKKLNIQTKLVKSFFFTLLKLLVNLLGFRWKWENIKNVLNIILRSLLCRYIRKIDIFLLEFLFSFLHFAKVFRRLYPIYFCYVQLISECRVWYSPFFPVTNFFFPKPPHNLFHSKNWLNTRKLSGNHDIRFTSLVVVTFWWLTRVTLFFFFNPYFNFWLV